MIPQVGLADIAFPYRAKRAFGAASFALLFLTLLAEIELLALIGMAVSGRVGLFFELQPVIVPAAVLVSLAAAAVFAWRARGWTKTRMETVRLYTSQASGYAERLAQQHRSQG